MPIDKPALAKLKRFSKVFTDARDRDANESDTVMYLIEFFKEVLDYDPLGGEISKEVQINDRFCDFSVRLDGKVAFLVEAKAAGIQSLKEKHIEQAENYASRAGVNWVLLTNGVFWQLYHLTFGDSIKHELVFEGDLIEDLEERGEWLWDTLSVLNKRSVREGSLDTYYEQQKLLNPKNIVNLLLDEEVLMKIRQQLNRKAPTRIDLSSVFEAVRDVLSQEALASAGDILPPAKRKHRRKAHRADDEPAEAAAQQPSERLAAPPACAGMDPAAAPAISAKASPESPGI